MIDIANARALVETLKDYAEHPSSFTDISPTEADATADLIAALLDERERLIKIADDAEDMVRTERAERDAWERDYQDMRRFQAKYIEADHERIALKAERDALAREVDACAAALPGPYYMDPPDGGDVPISEQVKRMARDAANWKEEARRYCENADFWRGKVDAVREVYAGMEGFVPQTAPEGYCLDIIKKMAHAAMGITTG